MAHKTNALKTDKSFIYFTLPIVILMAVTSSIGIFYQGIYSRETIDWFSQTIGQDFSNLFVTVPALILSAFFASKGNRVGKIIWTGVMITNVYAFVIYSFALHFNFLFHVYCAILGLSIYSVIYFFIKNLTVDFKSWFTDRVPVKAVGIFLIVIAALFTLLWLSQSLPAALINQAPESITKDGLLTNPVHALDLSFYLPLIFISAIMLLKKKSLGYLLAPMMIVFAVMTNINIILLLIASMVIMVSNTWPTIIVFVVFTMVCFLFMWQMFRHLRKVEED
ncbi:hypothetical protein [Sporolactobacillus pectinivorans]|uniref:hypothetical protein n=1 Tax=Sporolactobacillus pectinivorans TaxID=1591408 RepID=UPI001960E13A|nr:hypothetical protein [Sporolactobacillus pectinivorans]